FPGGHCLTDCSDDCNENGVPDECASEADCDGNDIPDICEIEDTYGGLCSGGDCLSDVDCDGVPDGCDDLSSTGACCLGEGNCEDLS
ncbi:MAG: hypothetical protein JSU63_09395, partial [Phycisphaerales bacterium]